jgi:hypothetical protein
MSILLVLKLCETHKRLSAVASHNAKIGAQQRLIKSSFWIKDIVGGDDRAKSLAHRSNLPQRPQNP